MINLLPNCSIHLYRANVYSQKIKFVFSILAYIREKTTKTKKRYSDHGLKV